MIQTYSPVSSPVVDIRQSVHRCLEQHVERYANRIALKTRTRSLTYRDMNAAANGLALQLRPIITPQTFVATLLNENIDIMVAILAICKAGGIWLPLDGRLPARTKNALLERVEIMAIIADDASLRDAAELSPDTPVVKIRSAYENATVVNLPYDGVPEDLFCLWMTGGTTGVFKAMATTHEQRLHGPSFSANDASLVSSDRSVYFGSLNFGAAFGNVANALMCGAATHFLNPIQETPASVFQWMRDEEVTIFTSSPSLFRSIFAQALPAPLPALRLIRTNSEPLLQADFELFKRTFPAGQAKLMNIYATTEASYLTHFIADHTTQLDGTLIPVGRQSTTTEVFVLDDHGNKIIDEPGEIVVRGRLVPEGYWRAPELSEGKFLVDPGDPDYRIVHSGDRGIMRADGNLLHLGRMDSMVKIRGFRVELMDIENLLRKHPAIAQATVQTLDDQGVTRLVAYIVPYRGNAAPSASQLREMLSENLPDFMLPSQYILLDEIPLMPNGKINIRALPRPQTNEQTSLVPATATETVLLELMRKVLPAPISYRDDNFFDLGGDSLGAIRLIENINQHFGVNLTPGSIYDHPSLAQLAEYIDRGAPVPTSLVALNPYGTQPPLIGISGVSGNPIGLRHLVAALGYNFPFHAFQHPLAMGSTEGFENIPNLARFYLEILAKADLPDSLYLLGYSIGGQIVLEMAQQLYAQGKAPLGVIVLDSHFSLSQQSALGTMKQAVRSGEFNKIPAQLIDPMYRIYKRTVKDRLVSQPAQAKSFTGQIKKRLAQGYRPQLYPGEIIYVKCERYTDKDKEDQRAEKWAEIAQGKFTLISIACTHDQLIEEPYAHEVGQHLSRLIKAPVL